MKRLVIVADNPMIVAAIRMGLRESGAFEILGYVDPRKTTAARITQAGAEVVLIDEGEASETAIALIQALREQNEDTKLFVLALRLQGEWIERALAAGADGVMSKAIHPAALATVIRETVAGHLVHSHASLFPTKPTPRAVVTEHRPLTGRETEILRLVSSGATNGEIAQRLWITQQTVKFHVANIYRKLEVANRTEACHYAHLNGMVMGAEADSPVRATRHLVAVA